MSTIEVKLSDSLLAEARKLAEQEQISLDYFVALAVTERVTALRDLNYLKIRAGGGDPAKLKEILQRAPDIEPDITDRMMP